MTSLADLEPEQQEIVYLRTLERRTEIRAMEASLTTFIRGTNGDGANGAWNVVEPGKKLVWNWHLDEICFHLEKLAAREHIKHNGYSGPFNRLIINVPPRGSKSTIVSVCYPAWVWLRDQSHQFLCISHNTTLAARDGWACRNLVQSEWFKERWGDAIKLVGDQNEKTNYKTTKNGHRNSVGITSGITGKGGSTIILDDPHDAEGAQSDAERQAAIDSYDSQVITRLNDPSESAIIVIMQRLHQRDLAGYVLDKEKDRGWVHLNFPMEYVEKSRTVTPFDGHGDHRKKEGALLWPARFPPRVVRFYKTKPIYQSQYQQDPKIGEGGIIPSKRWQIWPQNKKFPPILYVIQSWDTAFTEQAQKEAAKNQENAYSAMTEWGIFEDEWLGGYSALLLFAWRDHCAYPDLVAAAKEFYQKRKPDIILIEKKASGQSLIQDLRRQDYPITQYQPDRDKIARAYAVQSVFWRGRVYAPERNWANDVIAECAAFPKGLFADYVDTVTQALIRLQQAHWLKNEDEQKQEDELRREPGNDSDFGNLDVVADDTRRPAYG